MTDKQERNISEPVPPLKKPAGPDKDKAADRKQKNPVLTQVEGDSPRRGP